MISKEVKGSSGKAYFVIPEDADDLLTLRRIIESGDYIIADTTRVIKQTKEYARPDKGERIKVRVSIRIENINLDDAVDRLRITGSITNSNSDLVSRGTHHSLAVQVGDTITIDKDRKWQAIEISILKKSGNNPTTETFFGEVTKTIAGIWNVFLEEHDSNKRMIIFGPGETKRRFYNLLITKHQFGEDKVSVIDGVDVAGEDGIFVFLRSSAIKESMGFTKLAMVSSILDKVMLLVHRGEMKYSIGMQEVSYAASMKAVEYVVFSDA